MEEKSSLTRRDGQQRLGEAVFSNVYNRGHLVGEAPTGTGKSLVSLLPAIAAKMDFGHRTVISTETLSLLDQIGDKDLPFLDTIFSGYKWAILKGRNNYLCGNKAGSGNPIVTAVLSKMGERGERRDVEAALGRRLDDFDWEDICGDTDFCGANMCMPDKCFATRAREKACDADIVVTSHAMLYVHSQFIQAGDPQGLLGSFDHVVIDEAHSFEQVIVNQSTQENTPWDISKRFNRINDAGFTLSKYGAEIEGLERKVRAFTEIVQNFFEYETGKDMQLKDWKRESMALCQVGVLNPSDGHRAAMIAYEETAPELAAEISEGYTRLADSMKKDLDGMERGTGKVVKGMNAARQFASLFGIISNAMTTSTGMVEAYGTVFGVFLDGIVSRDMNKNEKKGIIIRAVPLDVSNYLKEYLWKHSHSVTAISATLKDQTDGSFRFVKRSVGLSKESAEIVVDSPFDFSQQQLIYLTPGGRDDVGECRGSRFSMSELRELIDATNGRTLVLFTALAEMEYVADALRYDPTFNYTLLVQEPGADKALLAEQFKADTHSVLLGSKSFFQGFDVPGESLSSVIMVKYSNLRWDPQTKMLSQYWRRQGFPKFYDMKSMEVFVQAFGRGIRSATDKVVCSLLDERVSDTDQNVHKTVHGVLSRTYPDSPISSNIIDVKNWLA